MADEPLEAQTSPAWGKAYNQQQLAVETDGPLPPPGPPFTGPPDEPIQAAISPTWEKAYRPEQISYDGPLPPPVPPPDEPGSAIVSPTWERAYRPRITEGDNPRQVTPEIPDEPTQAAVSPTWERAYRPEQISYDGPLPARGPIPDEPIQAWVSPTWQKAYNQARTEYDAPQNPPRPVTSGGYQPVPGIGPQFHPMLGPPSPSGRAFDGWQPAESGESAPVTISITFTETGAAADVISAVAVSEFPAPADAAAVTDGLSVVKLPLQPMGTLVTPGPATFPGPPGGQPAGQVHPSDPRPPVVLPIASPAFISRQMPTMHVENLVTGQWLHRDVQNVSSPLITWMLNGADTFTCTLSPPRRDLLDSSGNPIFNEWQAACYLEERNEIKFGGILTGSQFNGPQWSQIWTGFAGYPNGIPYEGLLYSQNSIDALDVVRYIWNYLQSLPGGDLKLILDNTKAGSLLGLQTNPGNFHTTITGATQKGAKSVLVKDSTGFRIGMKIQIGGQLTGGQLPTTGGDPNVIAGMAATTPPGSGTAVPAFITLQQPVQNFHRDGALLQQSPFPIPFQLAWWNTTDLGQEITSIQQEAVFDYREVHTWSDAQKNRVRHNLRFGVPRIGSRRSELRFVEGENIAIAVQGTRDGTTFANHVIGVGAGTGRTTIRSEASDASTGRLRRVSVYQDQTVRTAGRMSSKAHRVLRSKVNIDTFTQVTVKNHPNAEFGTFTCGDDILVTAASGWRNASIWHRIIQMQQDPTTDEILLTLARSDSFDYLAQSGQAGTL